MHIISIDTETGGLFPSIHSLLAIGASCSWGSEFEVYITPESQPGTSVDVEAAAVNGYSPFAWETLRAQPLLAATIDFLDWLAARKKEQPAAVIVCHNLAFDKAFLAEAARKVGRADLPGRHDWRCSMVKLAELMDAGQIEKGSASLNRLMQLSHSPIERFEKHNALQDARATLYGYNWLISKAAEPVKTMQHLYRSCITERKRLEAFIMAVHEAIATSHDPARTAANAAIMAELETLAVRFDREGSR